jgi:hypothetical protein
MQFSRNDFLLKFLLIVLKIRKTIGESFADFFVDLGFTHQRIHHQREPFHKKWEVFFDDF